MCARVRENVGVWVCTRESVGVHVCARESVGLCVCVSLWVCVSARA